MNHCQICGREIKNKLGLIAHHGYERPEEGWQTDSCIGARGLPYEKSRDIIPKAIQQIKNFIGLRETEIKKVEKGKIAVPSFRGKVEPNNTGYKIRQNEYLARLESEIKSANREIERLQKRYNDWQLIEKINKVGVGVVTLPLPTGSIALILLGCGLLSCPLSLSVLARNLKRCIYERFLLW